MTKVNFENHILKFWHIYLSILGMALFFQIQVSRIDGLEYRTNILEAKGYEDNKTLQTIYTKINTIEKSVVKIETDIEYIKKAI
jgi:hypothetical protein